MKRSAPSRTRRGTGRNDISGTSKVVALALLAALNIGAASAKDQQAIGLIKVVSGEAYVVRGSLKLRAKAGDRLLRNDVLETRLAASMGITMKDNTMLSMGPETRISLDRFELAPKDDRFAFVTSITQGTMQYISGLIAKLSPRSVTIKTPSANLGIRGTRLLIRIGKGNTEQ